MNRRPKLLAVIAASLLAGSVPGSAASAINWQAPILPDALKSPGDVLTSDPEIICKPGYTKTVRNVPQQLKEQVYREYGITSRENGEYEIDHLISLELGGSNSIRNLWPESYKTQPLNAHVKDAVENKLHELACSGQLTFPQAQQAIAHNWEEAYVQYIGPLPGGAAATKLPNQPSIPMTHVPTLPRGAEVPSSERPTLTPPGQGATEVKPDEMPDDSGTSDRAALPSSGSTKPSGPVSGAGAGNISQPALPNPDGSCPAEAPIKVSQSGIYHLPQGDDNYSRTHARSCFVSAQAAQAAGYRAPK